MLVELVKVELGALSDRVHTSAQLQGFIANLREHLAVQCAHNRCLLAENEKLRRERIAIVAYVRNLEAQLGARPIPTLHPPLRRT